MQEDLEDEAVTEGVNTIARHTLTKERQPQAMSELSYHQLNQPSQQDHAPSYPQPTQNQGEGTTGGRTSRFLTRPKHSRTDPVSYTHLTLPTTVPV